MLSGSSAIRTLDSLGRGGDIFGSVSHLENFRFYLFFFSICVGCCCWVDRVGQTEKKKNLSEMKIPERLIDSFSIVCRVCSVFL